MSISLPRPPKKIHIDVSLAIVNIVLLLIFFFLVIGHTGARSEAGIDIAHTRDLPVERLPAPLLAIGADQDWRLDDAPISPDLLGVAVQDLAPDATLYILIDREVPAETLVDLLNRPELRQRPLSLVTLRESRQAGSR